MTLGTVYQYKSRVVARLRREIEQVRRKTRTRLFRSTMPLTTSHQPLATRSCHPWGHGCFRVMNRVSGLFLTTICPSSSMPDWPVISIPARGCRRTLERLAAGSRLWADLRGLAPMAGPRPTGGCNDTETYGAPHGSPSIDRGHALDFLAPPSAHRVAGSTWTVRGVGGARPRRIWNRFQGVRPGTRTHRGRQGTGRAARHQRGGSETIRPRGESGGRGRP